MAVTDFEAMCQYLCKDTLDSNSRLQMVNVPYLT